MLFLFSRGGSQVVRFEGQYGCPKRTILHPSGCGRSGVAMVVLGGRNPGCNGSPIAITVASGVIPWLYQVKYGFTGVYSI